MTTRGAKATRRNRRAAQGAEQLESRVLPSTFPQIVSIAPQNAQFTGQAKYTVTFSTNVTGVDAADFAVSKTGSVAVGSPLQVTGSGSVYTVTASNLTGIGSLGVNLVDNNTIRDLSNNPLINSTALYTYSAAQNFTLGNSPSSVGLGNLNAGGKLDLVIANKAGNSVSFLLGNGNGTFATAQNFPTESNPNSVTLFDLNSDARLDAVTGNQGSGSLSVVGGNGAGSSTETQSFPAGNGVSSVVAGFVDGDTNPDLVLDFFDSGFNSVVSLLGNGNSTFKQAAAFATPGPPAALGLSDVNFDGHPDLLVVHGTSSNTVSVMLGRGDGTFSPGINYATGTNPTSVSVSDLNGDTLPDMVVTNNSGSSLSVFFGHGDGSFDAAKNIGTAAGPLSVAAGDVNGDGRADLVFARSGVNSISVRLATSNGNFTGEKANIAAVAGSTSDASGVSTAPDVNSATSATYTFSVQFASRTAVNVSTIKNGNVTVTGPNGFSITPVFVSGDILSNGTPRSATYTFTVPAGGWKTTNNGQYTINSGATPVKDTSGNSVTGKLGTFFVNLPFTIPAGTTNVAIRLAGTNFEYVDVDHNNQVLGTQPIALPITINGRTGATNVLRVERNAVNNPSSGKIVFNGGTGGQNTLIIDTTDTRITQSPTNLNAAIGQFTFNDRQIVTYGNVQTLIPIVRMYRAYNILANQHVFSTSSLEFKIITSNGLQDETTNQPGWAVSNRQVAGSTGVLRLYNPNNGEHYYTLAPAERDSLVALGLHDEGVEGYMFTTHVPGTTPIFRLYNQVSGEHLYTESVSYRDAVLAGFPGVWITNADLGFSFAVADNQITGPASTAGQTDGLSAAQALPVDPTAADPTANDAQPELGIVAIAPDTPDSPAPVAEGQAQGDADGSSGGATDGEGEPITDEQWMLYTAAFSDGAAFVRNVD